MEKEKNSPAATRKASCDNDFILVGVVAVEVVPGGVVVYDVAMDRGDDDEAALADCNNGWTRTWTPSNVAATF